MDARTHSGILLYLPISKVLILKSIPMVEIKVGLKVLSANRNIMQVLPTPLSPMRRSLKNKSKFFAILRSLFRWSCVTLPFQVTAFWGNFRRSGYQTSVTRSPEPEVMCSRTMKKHKRLPPIEELENMPTRIRVNLFALIRTSTNFRTFFKKSGHPLL